MHCKTIPALRRFALALGFGCMASGASAGLVTGVWDPEFGGSVLPNLSWAVRANLLVPNSCSNQGDGIYNTGSCAQANITVQDVWLRLYDTGYADPNDFFTVVGGLPNAGVSPVRSTYWTFGGGFSVTSVRIQDQQVVGFDMVIPATAQTVVFDSPNYYSYPSSAGGNSFGLSFDVDGPILECFSCRQNITDPFGPTSEFASTTNLTQFLVTYTSDDTSVAKFTDAGGAPLGAVLDGAGNYLGQSTWANLVPEPGALTLVATALAALALTRRRRA